MKVICIDDSKHPLKYGGFYRTDWWLEYGKIYTVNENSGGFYSLNEDPRKGSTWKASRFVPLSDIDETEFIRNYNKQLA